METCEQPILAGFADESLYSAQASHVSRRVLPGSDEAARMTVGSGRQCSMLFDQSSPLGAFSKILLESLAWGNSEECCHVWARWDTAFELSAFELRRWEQATTESGCSLLPTPTVPGGRVNPEGTSVTGRKPDGSKAQMDLGHAIKLELSSTPHANCPTGAGTQGRDGGMNLQPQPEHNLSLPVPLCISNAEVWVTLWKAELAWNGNTLVLNMPASKTLIPPEEPEKPQGGPQNEISGSYPFCRQPPAILLSAGGHLPFLAHPD